MVAKLNWRPLEDARSPRSELLAGSREISPVLIGTVPFGFVAGVAAISAGMTPVEGIALSVLSFSGIAQLVSCQLVAVQSPEWLAIAAAAVVSLRFLMYSAAFSPHLAHLDTRWRVLISYLMTDQSFAMSVRRFSEPGDRRHAHWHFLGSALTLYVSWQAAVILGVLAGASVPASLALDFSVVLCFVALLVPAVRTRADLAAAIVAGAFALVAAGLPFRLSLVVASVAGIAAGLAIELRHDSSTRRAEPPR
jgi:predicted branched-subunit amino acid permease